jgi:hypothetical protein
MALFDCGLVHTKELTTDRIFPGRRYCLHGRRVKALHGRVYMQRMVARRMDLHSGRICTEWYGKGMEGRFSMEGTDGRMA